MNINQPFIAELQHEAQATRKMLERVPFDKFSWKPHEKSMTLGRLAGHVAELPGWVTATVQTNGLDFAVAGYNPKEYNSTEEMVADFDRVVSKALDALANTDNETIMKNWKLSNGETVYFDMPRVQVLRGFCYNHSYHHRGQLSVYLRELGVPLPSVYGPTADEQM